MVRVRVSTPRQIIGVLEKHKQDLDRLAVKKIALFGSYLYSRKSKRSDIDFIVEFSEPTFDNYIELKFLLEKLFGKKVDLVLEKNLKPSLKYVKRQALYAKAI